jgi:hypothetical protein
MYSSNWDGSLDDATLKLVTDCPATAVHIFNSFNGTTRGWIKEVGFNPNTIATWIIYKNQYSDWAPVIINNIEGYAIKADLTAYTSMSTRPIITQVTINSKIFDLPSKNTTNDPTLVTYVDGVAVPKAFLPGWGGGGANQVLLTSYPAQGSIVTADFQGYLRILSLFKRQVGDRFSEIIDTYTASGVPMFNVNLDLEQSDWF